MKLDAALRDVTRLGIDSAPLIYLVESHARYDALVLEVFRQIDERRFEGVTSVVSLGEVLVQPLRDGDAVLHRRYRELLFDTPRLSTLDIVQSRPKRRLSCARVTDSDCLTRSSWRSRSGSAARRS